MLWLAIIIPGIAASLAIIGFTARGLLIFWRFLKGVVKISDSLPTLLSIAEQFKPNGGNSLHDRLTTLNGKIDQTNQALDALRQQVQHH